MHAAELGDERDEGNLLRQNPSEGVGMALATNGQPITGVMNASFDIGFSVRTSRVGEMQIESPARQREAPSAVRGDELAEGLMLVRASTLKMIRLQLAMERQDRRGALEAVDDLVALDRRLQDCLAHIPADGDRLMFRHALDTERALLNREKLTLAAEVICKPADRLIQADESAGDEWLGPRDLPQDEIEEPRRRRWWLALVIPAVAAGLAAGADAVGLVDGQMWLAQVAELGQ